MSNVKKRNLCKLHRKRITDLASQIVEPEKKLGGRLMFFPEFFTPAKAGDLFLSLKSAICPLLEIPSFVTQGNAVQQPRQCVWYGPCRYQYSRYTLKNRKLQSCHTLNNIRMDLQQVFGVELNSCFVNVYRDGNDGVGWHADDEKIFGKYPFIVSLSVGATRRFDLCRSNNLSRKPEITYGHVHK